MEADFWRWSFLQMNLQKRYHPKDKSGSVLSSGHPSLSPEVRWQLSETNEWRWTDFISITRRMRPLFSEKNLRMYIVPQVDLPIYSVTNGFYNLSMMNLIRSLVSVVYRGYAEGASEKGRNAGIRRDELQAFYSQFRDLGIDLGILDRRNVRAGCRSFMEGSLFTYSASGLKEKMSMVEAIELFAHLYSGSQLAHKLYDQLVKVCLPSSSRSLGLGRNVDINGVEKINRLCVERQLSGDLLSDNLSNMPGLQGFLRAFPDVREEYGPSLLEAVFVDGKSERGWVELNELSVFSVVLHYAEAMVTRYDTDHNGILTSVELEGAADVIGGFIKFYVHDYLNKDVSDDFARDVFSYILYYQKMPTNSDALAVFLHGVRRSLVPPEIRLDRMDVARILRMIIGKLLEKRSADDQSLVSPPNCHK